MLTFYSLEVLQVDLQLTLALAVVIDGYCAYQCRKRHGTTTTEPPSQEVS